MILDEFMVITYTHKFGAAHRFVSAGTIITGLEWGAANAQESPIQGSEVHTGQGGKLYRV